MAPLRAHADHEEFRPPRAFRVAVPGPVRALDRLRPARGVALRRGPRRGLPAPQILFYDENCQKWVAQEIVKQETEVRKVDAGSPRSSSSPPGPSPSGSTAGRVDEGLRARFVQVHNRRDASARLLIAEERKFDEPVTFGPRDVAAVRDQAALDLIRRNLQVDEGRTRRVQAVERSPQKRPARRRDGDLPGVPGRRARTRPCRREPIPLGPTAGPSPGSTSTSLTRGSRPSSCSSA